MEEHECDWPETCPVCKGPAPKPETSKTAPFLAKYDGHCGGDCNLPIYKGDKIVLVFEGLSTQGRPVHVGCT